ncbi:MAG: efflux RND transporter periplasmic adaptor subunit [Elusimicrobia bacterium]|nr:efflux RND transporter periplasmic adaptor subunit [Elusimicrobiota bacterium]
MRSEMGGLTRARIVAISLAALAAGGVFTYRFYKKRQLERVQLDISALVKVERGTLENKFQENGDIWPRKLLNIFPNVSGRVVELPVGDGQSVKAGQTLAVVQGGRTSAEKFLPATIGAPITGALMRCPEEGGRNGGGTKEFVKLDDFVTGRNDSQQNATCMMAIADLSSLIVKLTINEVDVLKFRENMPVTVTVDALPGETFPGTVTVISRQAEEGYRRAGKVFRTEIALNRRDERLRVGMTGRVTAMIAKKENVLKMSLGAFFEQEGRSVAYLNVPRDKPREVEIKPGMRTPLEVEIVSGLKEGEQVFTEKPVDFVPLPKAPR